MTNKDQSVSRWPLRFALSLALAGASFFAGRASAPKPQIVKARAPAATLASIWKPAVQPDVPLPAVPKRIVVAPPLELAQVEDGAAAEQLRRYEQEQSEDLVKLLRTRLKRIAIAAGRDDVPEASVVQMAEYSAGWIDAVIRTAPSLADDLAHEVETVLCDPESGDAERLLLARMGRHMPEITSVAAFECALGEGAREDAVLWEALDALRGSGLPAPKALDALRARATDERTLQRLQMLDARTVEELRLASGQATVRDYEAPQAADAPAEAPTDALPN